MESSLVTAYVATELPRYNDDDFLHITGNAIQTDNTQGKKSEKRQLYMSTLVLV